MTIIRQPKLGGPNGPPLSTKTAGMTDVLALRKLTKAEALANLGSGIDLSQTNQQSLAARWGWSKQQVSRVLKDWEKTGAISRDGLLVQVTGPGQSQAGAVSSRKPEVSRVSAPVAASDGGQVAHRVNAGLLVALGVGLGLVGLAMNLQFGASQGVTPLGRTTFMTIGVIADLIEVFGVGMLVSFWRVRSKAGVVTMGAIWLLALVVTLTASAGFMSSQLGDTAAARSKLITDSQRVTSRIAELDANKAALALVVTPTPQEIQAASDAVASARSDRDKECVKVGDNCRQRIADLNAREIEQGQVLTRKAKADALAEIDRELRSLHAKQDGSSVIANADPTATFIRSIVRRVSLDHVGLSDREIRYLRVMSLGSLPSIGGILFGLGVTLWSEISRRGRQEVR